MTKTNLINILIALCLIFFLIAFAARESFFPFHAYDIYRKPMAAPSFRGVQSLWQISFFAKDDSGLEYELKSDHPFFFPFDQFLFTEVVFFNTMRVHEKHPLEEKSDIEKRMRAQLLKYNQTLASRPIRRLLVYWNDIELNEQAQNTIDGKTLVFEVAND